MKLPKRTKSFTSKKEIVKYITDTLREQLRASRKMEDAYEDMFDTNSASIDFDYAGLLGVFEYSYRFVQLLSNDCDSEEIHSDEFFNDFELVVGLERPIMSFKEFWDEWGDLFEEANNGK